MLNILSFLVLMQVSVLPAKSYNYCHHPYQGKCSDCWKCMHNARMRDCLQCHPKKIIDYKPYPMFEIKWVWNLGNKNGKI